MPEGQGYPPNEGTGAAPAPEGGQGPDAMMASMKQVADILPAMGEGAQKAGAPPEALNALKAAIGAYNEFLAIMTGGAQQGESNQQAAPDVAGNPNAVPTPV